MGNSHAREIKIAAMKASVDFMRKIRDVGWAYDNQKADGWGICFLTNN